MLVDGKKTGKNFVNEFTFNYAKYRVENKQHNETIDEYRLFNNMLSSQPMAFNLFCPFIRMLKEGKEKVVTTIFKAIFPDKHMKQILKGMKVVTQIYRNFLLTECYGIKEGANRCYSVVLAPAQHPTTEHEVASLKDELIPEYQYIQYALET